MGTVYLLHFDEAIAGRALHYVGYTTNLDRRLAMHAAGRGARLLEVCKERGVHWRVAVTWVGGRDLERAVKAKHNHRRLCPVCKAIAGGVL